MALLASPSAAQSSTVFVTSTTHNGNLGGLSGADAICQGLADAASLPGTYMAWLSDSTGTPDTRFVKSTSPYTLIDGTILADDWDELIDGSLNARINLDEIGSVPYPPQVWTNTKNDGKAFNPNDCNDWTSGTNADHSRVSSTVDDSFQPLFKTTCNNGYRLYCFQQLSPQNNSSNNQSQASSQLTANTWAVTYQGDAAVDFTSSSTNEVTLSYLIGAGQTPVLNLYASPDCSTETAVDVVGLATTSFSTTSGNSLDTIAVGIDIDKTKIVGSNIWDATDSSLEFCLAVTLESGGMVITEE